MNAEITFYAEKFRKLRLDRSHGVAPHKPVLLLSIIDLIEKNEISSNRIVPSIKITEAFLKYWSGLNIVTHKPTVHLPFYHLKSEGFWHLHPNEGHVLTLDNIKTVKTFTQLKNIVKFATLDDDLFALLASKDNRNALKELIYQTYFPERSSGSSESTYSFLEPFQLFPSVAEQQDLYVEHLKISAAKKKRDISFRNRIMSIYDFTCSMCRRRVITLDGETIVDAAHIVPFKDSKNDDIRNGFSLCKNHHWTFDRGLVSVDEEYRVMISPKIDSQSIITLDLEGRKIMLPDVSNCNPSHQAFDWHRRNRFYD